MRPALSQTRTARGRRAVEPAAGSWASMRPAEIVGSLRRGVVDLDRQPKLSDERRGLARRVDS